jgi:hypothetical protein
MTYVVLIENILDIKFSPCYKFVFFLLGDFPASEFCMPTFRNTVFHLHKWSKQEKYVSRYSLVKTYMYKILRVVACMKVMQDISHVAPLGVSF